MVLVCSWEIFFCKSFFEQIFFIIDIFSQLSISLSPPHTHTHTHTLSLFLSCVSFTHINLGLRIVLGNSVFWPLFNCFFRGCIFWEMTNIKIKSTENGKEYCNNFKFCLNLHFYWKYIKIVVILSIQIDANLVTLATACVFYWSPGVCLGH